MMISVALSVIVIGALLGSSMSIQRAIHGSETFSNNYSDQRRITDYLARDLRRSTNVAADDPSGQRVSAASKTIKIADGMVLVVSIPGYYKSNNPSDTDYTWPLSVVETDKRLDYGSENAFAEPVEVSFRKDYVAGEHTLCFVRREAGLDQVIVRKAEKLSVEVSISADQRSGTVKAWFLGPYGSAGPVIATYDEFLLRNAPMPFHP